MVATRLEKLYQAKSSLIQFYLMDGILERRRRTFAAAARVERSPF
jgi:hypothetical protein